MGAPNLFGREQETSQLYDALAIAAQNRAQVVLVGGDAGIGKTTLVSDLAHRATELGFAVSFGHCLDIEADIPLAPVVEAARGLLGPGQELDHRPFARHLLGLLTPAPPTADASRLLDDLRLALLEAAGSRPTLVILEDLHWADRSTRDFVTALTRTVDNRLLLVLTYRSDELHCRHPLRLTLAELGHLEASHRIDLAPLADDAVTALIRARSTTRSVDLDVADILRRAEGNPLYAEELAASGTSAVPQSLSDLLLAHVDALPDDSRALMRLASVGGTQIDTELLVELAGTDPVSVERMLSEALQSQVLRNDVGSVAYRHGLLREAVYDDLLPDERSRLHARYATALQRRVDSQLDPGLAALSRLAHHWSEAHHMTEAYVSSVQAGVAASRYGAVEAVAHLERALALRDRVPDPEQVVGMSRVQLLLELAEAHIEYGDRAEFDARVRQAVSLLEPLTDPLVASRAYATLARSLLLTDDAVGEAEAIALALAHAGESPSPERAQALSAESRTHHRAGRYAEAVRAASEARDVAREAEHPYREVEALHRGAMDLLLLGRVPEALAAEERAAAVARSAELFGVSLVATSNLAWYLMIAGDVERGLALARDGQQEGLALALPAEAALCGEQLEIGLMWLGRWAEAEALLPQLRAWGLAEQNCALLEGELAVARGDVMRATELDDAGRLAIDPGSVYDEFVGDLVVSLRLMQSEQRGARDVARELISDAERGDSPWRRALAACTAFRALASTDRTESRRDDDLAAAATRASRWSLQRLTDEWSATYAGSRLVLGEALAVRRSGRAATEELRQALHRAEPFGAYVALEPRLFLAEALLSHGERDEGRESLVAVWSDARDMGAGEHERRAFRLATRARVPLPRDAVAPGPLSRLTPREREVLDLLAEGATNRAISEELFISEKTASVHVSHLLAKLDVPNRGAAAALARRYDH